MATNQPPPPTGPVFVGKRGQTDLATTAAMLSAMPEVGGILVVHAPTCEDDNVGIAALTACAQSVKVPLLIAAMGEETGLRHRHALNEASLACFESPEAAIAGFRHLLENQRNRDQARELPASAVLTIQPDHQKVVRHVQTALSNGRSQLVQDEALAILGAYHIPTVESRHATTPKDAALKATKLGFPVVLKLSHPGVPTNQLAGSVVLNLKDATAVEEAAQRMLVRLDPLSATPDKASFVVQVQAQRGLMIRVQVADNPVLGPVIGVGGGGGDPEDISHLAIALPPLNLALAQSLIHRSEIAPRLRAMRGQAAIDDAALAAFLVRVSQLVIDTPEILTLDIDPIFATEAQAMAASARILLRPTDQPRPALVISPYPSELSHPYSAKGQNFLLRPIRPEDADALTAMLSRFSAEDMRFRFFAPLKRLPVEQIVRLTDIDYTREMAMIAVHETSNQMAGVARLVRNDTDGTSAEFAVAVDPGFKKFGLGTALMQNVIGWGQARGVKEILGQILADNTPMLTFIKRLGFTLKRLPDEPDVMEARLVF